MEGNMTIYFRILTDGGTKKIKLSEILVNEKVKNTIKTNFAKGMRGAEILDFKDCDVIIGKENKIYEIEIPKKDFQDAMSFVEEYVENKKLNKKQEQIEIVDFKIKS